MKRRQIRREFAELEKLGVAWIVRGPKNEPLQVCIKSSFSHTGQWTWYMNMYLMCTNAQREAIMQFWQETRDKFRE